MSDWQTLRRRIQEEVHRFDTDSQDRIERAMAHAIDRHKYEDFYFNEDSDTFNTTPGVFTYGQESSPGAGDGFPANFIKARVVTLEVDSFTQWPLRSVPMRRYRRDQITSSYRGYPDMFAWNEENFFFTPTPNGTYVIILDYTADIGTPEAKYNSVSAGWSITNSLDGGSIDDTFSNGWTDDGADFVSLYAQYFLYSNVWKDPQEAARTRVEAEKERRRLQREGLGQNTTTAPRPWF